MIDVADSDGECSCICERRLTARINQLAAFTFSHACRTGASMIFSSFERFFNSVNLKTIKQFTC
mgnify:CR=1 FL=1